MVCGFTFNLKHDVTEATQAVKVQIAIDQSQLNSSSLSWSLANGDGQSFLTFTREGGAQGPQGPGGPQGVAGRDATGATTLFNNTRQDFITKHLEGRSETNTILENVSTFPYMTFGMRAASGSFSLTPSVDYKLECYDNNNNPLIRYILTLRPTSNTVFTLNAIVDKVFGKYLQSTQNSKHTPVSYTHLTLPTKRIV